MSEEARAQTVALKRARGPFAWLLVAQVFFISMTPLVADTGTGWGILLSGVFAIILAGIFATRDRRGSLVVSVIFLLPALFAWIGPDLVSERVDDFLRFFTAAICFLFTCFVVLRSIRRQVEVTVETILGGINGYLLLTFAFMMLHAAILVAWPDAYELNGEPLKQQLLENNDSRGFATLLYFSFTTITTLGYGDIVPVHAGARLLTSVEAVVGQLYVAIFIARLVSLEVSQRVHRQIQ
jgi:hypothetical protein